MEQSLYRVCINHGDPVCGSAPGGGRQGRKEGIGSVTDCCGFRPSSFRTSQWSQVTLSALGAPLCSGSARDAFLPPAKGKGLGKHELIVRDVAPRDTCFYGTFYVPSRKHVLYPLQLGTSFQSCDRASRKSTIQLNCLCKASPAPPRAGAQRSLPVGSSACTAQTSKSKVRSLALSFVFGRPQLGLSR